MEAVAAVRHSYSPGEEVVLNLAGVDAHNVERGCVVERACLPSWTIGVVVERRTCGGGAGYVVRIEHDGCRCLCLVAEAAIEGVA